ncbi:MAG: hypothetical protein KAJ52_02690 [Sedimentisphaerales bacterium]|nr:hypothetical protein [Sedimentisphaerales bacterium]
MRKVMLASALCLIATVVAQAGIPIAVENAGFELPDYYRKINGFDGEVLNPDYPGTSSDEYLPDVPGWDDDATNLWPRSGVNGVVNGATAYEGVWKVFLYHGNGEGYAEDIVYQVTDKTITAGEIYALKAWCLSGGTYDTDVRLELSFFYVDGVGDHIELAANYTDVPDDDLWYACAAEFTVDDVPASIGEKLGIKFTNVDIGNDNVGWLGFDDVRLERVLVSNPDPCDGEGDVLTTTNLEWELESIVTNCDVYFGSDPNFVNNPKVVDAQNTEIYNPPVDLDHDTTYYWRVDARVGTTVYEGDIWEFTTIVAAPIILEDPCGLTVNAGETAVFRVKATNVDTYLWRKLYSPPLTDNTGPTLTITDVQKADEGVYWCELKKGIVPTNTAFVNLMTKRLVTVWDFEDSLNAKDDEEATCWPGAYTDPNSANEPPTPVYVLDPCSIDGGKALQFVADEFHVRITDSEDFFNFYPQGYTLNIWVKTEQDADYGCMTSKQDRNDYPDIEGWVLNCTNTGVAAHGLRQVFGSGAGVSVVGTSNIADNEWHMVTATYDAETGTGRVYVDGLLENQLVDTVRKAPINNFPVLFGAESISAELALYEGLLDKTSIYSYALSPVDVALLYINVMGGNLCVGGNPEYDFNGDCKVDVLDFANFVSDWLECNLVPDCLP